MPLIPALRRQRQCISEFEASLVYKVSSRTARAIQRNPVSEKKKNSTYPTITFVAQDGLKKSVSQKVDF